MQRPLDGLTRALARGLCIVGEFRYEYFVNDHVNIVLVLLFKLDALAQRFIRTVNNHFLEPFVEEVVQQLVVLPLTSNYHRARYSDFCSAYASRQLLGRTLRSLRGGRGTFTCFIGKREH